MKKQRNISAEVNIIDMYILLSEQTTTELPQPVDLLVAHFKHLPAVDELIDSPKQARDFMAAVSKYANEDEFADRNFEPPKSLDDFPMEIANIYSLSTHNTAHRIKHPVSIDFIRGNGIHRLIYVRFGTNGLNGDALRHTEFEGIQNILDSGIPLNAADVLHKDVHPRMEQPLDKLFKLFPKIIYKDFVGGNIFKPIDASRLVDEPGVFWVQGGQLVFNAARPDFGN